MNSIILLIKGLGENGINVRYLDIGGGLGIRYVSEEPPMPSDLASELIPILRDMSVTVIIEPGRSLVGNAGIFVTKVIYTKNGEGKEFIIVDGAMNDLIRPTLYGAFHNIIPVRKNRRKKILADIVGPICESGDFLGKARNLPRPERGELLAVMSSGAYGFSMSSNYNSRPRAAEVLVNGERHYLIKKRENLNDLIRGESIPGFL